MTALVFVWAVELLLVGVVLTFVAAKWDDADLAKVREDLRQIGRHCIQGSIAGAGASLISILNLKVGIWAAVVAAGFFVLVGVVGLALWVYGIQSDKKAGGS